MNKRKTIKHDYSKYDSSKKICIDCNQKLNDKANFSKHKREQRCKPLLCPDCKLPLKNIKEFINHYQKEHENTIFQLRYICHSCLFICYKKDHWNAHCQTIGHNDNCIITKIEKTKHIFYNSGDFYLSLAGAFSTIPGDKTVEDINNLQHKVDDDKERQQQIPSIEKQQEVHTIEVDEFHSVIPLSDSQSLPAMPLSPFIAGNYCNEINGDIFSPLNQESFNNIPPFDF